MNNIAVSSADHNCLTSGFQMRSHDTGVRLTRFPYRTCKLPSSRFTLLTLLHIMYLNTNGYNRERSTPGNMQKINYFVGFLRENQLFFVAYYRSRYFFFFFLIYLLTSHLHIVRLIIDFIYLFNDNRIFSFSQLLIYFDLNIMKLMHHRFSYRVEHLCQDISKLKSRN